MNKQHYEYEPGDMGIKELIEIFFGVVTVITLFLKFGSMFL